MASFQGLIAGFALLTTLSGSLNSAFAGAETPAPSRDEFDRRWEAYVTETNKLPLQEFCRPRHLTPDPGTPTAALEADPWAQGRTARQE